MALSADEKAIVDEVVDKLEELKETILLSIPMRSTGAGHVFNQILPLVDKLKSIPEEAPPAPTP